MIVLEAIARTLARSNLLQTALPLSDYCHTVAQNVFKHLVVLGTILELMQFNLPILFFILRRSRDCESNKIL